MENIGLNQLREMFLEFFESKGHLRLESAPLVPQNDNSLLLINAGMAPLKPYFTGELEPPAPRAVSCQKCIRTPDIENVGKDARHGTYFEMLGNFSFGDYFKRDAQKWAWEFITQQLRLPLDKVYVSVYLDDDESYDIWVNEIGVDPGHMVRLGKEDNFWEIGSGPCGPCSEIYFDRGEKYGCGSESCAPGCDCDRYVEFWNLVFTQFSSDGNGNYTPLQKKNIDTGMGLERIACIMQEVDSLFDVDTFASITNHVSRLTGAKYGEDAKKDVSLRIITDHIRSTVMMICDGIMPSNVGRGYVLRRLLRRAARHGRLLGVDEPFLYQVCGTVIAENEGAYPQLREKEDFIRTVIKAEEERFGGMIESGLMLLGSMIEKFRAEGQSILSGEEAFRLYDTNGFPIDLIIEILEEQGLSVDRARFDQLMSVQKKRAKEARGNTSELGWENDDADLKNLPKTVFAGYESMECKGEVLAIISGQLIDSAGEGDEVSVLVDKTPFYAESGGQVADQGKIKSDGAELSVLGVKKRADGAILHQCRVESGEITVGDSVTLSVDASRRKAISRAHTATHLLHKALRDTLGNHVQQSGSLVEPDRLRFDFSHYSALKAEELYTIENLVNNAILDGLDVTCTEMPVQQAREMGAMALFGEKYGNMVRVVKMGDTSIELCGGTHLKNTAQAGMFKILSEASVAAGIRRIEAVCGLESLELVREKEGVIVRAAGILKAASGDVLRRISQLSEDLRAMTSAKDALESKLAGLESVQLLDKAVALSSLRVLARQVGTMSMESLRSLSDSLRDRAPDLVSVLASVQEDGKIQFVAACGPEAVKRGAHAGNILKHVAAMCGGGGGGKPESATAGGKDAAKLGQALESVLQIAGEMLK